MPEQLLADTPIGSHTAPVEVLVSGLTLLLLAVLLVVDIKYLRDGKRIADRMDLPKGQWLRLVKALTFDPVVAFLLVGVLLGTDVVRGWEHLTAAAVGAVVGLGVGRARFPRNYVRAVPEHQAIVFVHSMEEYVALVVLVLVRVAAEQQRIPLVGPLALLITLLLAVVVFDSVGRAWFSYRRYRAEVAGTRA